MPLVRSMATQARGLPAILEKRPDDVVITFAKRTAMGRAKKGQLKDTPVDALMHALFKVSTVNLIANRRQFMCCRQLWRRQS